MSLSSDCWSANDVISHIRKATGMRAGFLWPADGVNEAE